MFVPFLCITSYAAQRCSISYNSRLKLSRLLSSQKLRGFSPTKPPGLPLLSPSLPHP